ncbi:TetR/AcrR family transcriptional regulator [Streptomyces sp. DSM 44917]|uniref:TetR/AcrR family transcriptional regulator n=1 Tax=Streptomyces boetiae TaxID=3075541 RepID=A0ABU2L7N0_9ACTN|nr:TetR/AcrR family transcriptional regulator [Streptomyces sp. DSM 44917]MDT0307566.1 TetR/AcrR family transcriptional regulator [Streptomyces sp. DSM 44917]
MPQQRGSRSRLTAADWAEAALDAMREGGGLAAIAIEPLASRLGATKGSFYWHFPNREALIEAALARWVERRVAEITANGPSEDPVARLRALFQRTVDEAAEDPTELALLAQADHPQVAAALRRVTARRMDCLTELFRALGLPEADARRRGVQAYCGYLGRAQLTRAVPEVLPQGDEERRRYVDSVIASLTAR